MVGVLVMLGLRVGVLVIPFKFVAVEVAVEVGVPV
jgi:hypothetical protein